MTTNINIFDNILDLRKKINDYKNNLFKINYLINNEINIKNIINFKDDCENKYNSDVILINIILFFIFILIIIFIIKIIAIYQPLIEE